MATPPHHHTSHHHTPAERRSLETWKYNFTVIIAHISSGESALRHILFQPYYIGKEKSNKKCENAYYRVG